MSGRVRLEITYTVGGWTDKIRAVQEMEYYTVAKRGELSPHLLERMNLENTY